MKNEADLEEYIKKLKAYNFDIDLLYNHNNGDDKYLNILLMFRNHSDAIKFLIKIKKDDCLSLQESAGDKDDGVLNVNDIKDFEECVTFKDNLEKKGNFENMIDEKRIKEEEEKIKREEELKRQKEEEKKSRIYYLINVLNQL